MRHDPTMPEVGRRQLLLMSAGALLAATCAEARAVRAARGWPPRPSAPQAPGAPAAPVAPAGYGPTESCIVTEDNILGPYYLPDAPERSDVRSGIDGTALDVAGRVQSVDCRPLSGVLVEIWQADARGIYDERGPKLRARLRTEADGSYRLATVLPGRYLNGSRYRPSHIHFRVVAPGHRTLVTQLYFEGDPYNEVDPFVRRSLIVPLSQEQGVRQARFDIVLAEAMR